MTYKQLVAEINLLSEEQKNQEVTVYVRGIDEFYPVSDRLLFADTEDQDVLNPDQPFIRV